MFVGDGSSGAAPASGVRVEFELRASARSATASRSRRVFTDRAEALEAAGLSE